MNVAQQRLPEIAVLAVLNFGIIHKIKHTMAIRMSELGLSDQKE